MTDILITYETLYEILRNEKNRDEIQELKQTFYTDAAPYLAKNQKNLDEAFARGASEQEREDIARQVKNIKSIIREIYERREKKIIQLALTGARSGIDDVGVEVLLPFEKELYLSVKRILSQSRDLVISKVMISLTPSSQSTISRQEIQKKEQEPEHKQEQSEQFDEQEVEHDSEYPTPETASDTSRYTIKFNQMVPKFLGRELEVYGPFDIDDVATLPNEISQILIKQGKAILVE